MDDQIAILSIKEPVLASLIGFFETLKFQKGLVSQAVLGLVSNLDWVLCVALIGFHVQADHIKDSVSRSEVIPFAELNSLSKAPDLFKNQLIIFLVFIVVFLFLFLFVFVFVLNRSLRDTFLLFFIDAVED